MKSILALVIVICFAFIFIVALFFPNLLVSIGIDRSFKTIFTICVICAIIIIVSIIYDRIKVKKEEDDDISKYR